METRQFGKTDMGVSVLGFGGAEIGFEKAEPARRRPAARRRPRRGPQRDRHRRVLPRQRGIDRPGRSPAGARFPPLHQVRPPRSPGVEDWRPESLLASIERSLRRLKTDRVDLVQLHSCSEAELRKGT